MTRRITVRGLAALDGKILCVRHKAYKNPDGGQPKSLGHWCLPGGGLEAGEALNAGVAREMLEETGIPAQVGRLLYVQQFAHGGEEFLEFFFHIENGRDYANVDLTKSTHGGLEIDAIAYIEPRGADLLPAFLATEDIFAHIAAGQPPKIFSSL